MGPPRTCSASKDRPSSWRVSLAAGLPLVALAARSAALSVAGTSVGSRVAVFALLFWWRYPSVTRVTAASVDYRDRLLEALDGGASDFLPGVAAGAKREGRVGRTSGSNDDSRDMIGDSRACPIWYGPSNGRIHGDPRRGGM